MQYRRERLMVPLAVVSTLMAIFALVVIYLVAIVLPGLNADYGNLERDRDKVRQENAQLRSTESSLTALIGTNPIEVNGYLAAMSSAEVDRGYSVTRIWNAFLNDGGINGTGSKTPFPSVAPYIKALKDVYKNKEDASVSELKKQEADYKTLLKARQSDIDSKADAISRLNNDVQTRKTDYDILKGEYDRYKLDKDNEIRSLNGRISTLQATAGELDKANKELVDKLGTSEKRLDAANLQIEEQKVIIERQQKPSETVSREPSGEVTNITRGPDGIIGSINVGARDGLKAGTVFEVLRGDSVKGLILVYRVDEANGYFRVVKLAKETEPIVPGDLVTSPIFTKGKKHEYVIIGNFKSADFPYSADDIKRIIEQGGGVVADEISTNTKYAIIGEGELTEEQLQSLKTYSVERISKARLRDFIEPH